MACLIQRVFAVRQPDGEAGTMLPIGHTASSWQSSPLARPPGHTAFSWLNAWVDPVEFPHVIGTSPAATDARLACAELRFLWRAPPTYYSWTLAERARFLGAPVDTLCKSLVLVNTALPEGSPVTEDPSTSKFIMVVIQYVSRLDTDRLGKSLRAHAPASFSSAHRLAVAAEADSAALTAYGHNAVTPPGCQTAIPVVVSEAIAGIATKRQGASVWLGGGHVDVKLRIPVAELLRAGALFPVVSAPLVLSCTDPRSPADADD